MPRCRATVAYGPRAGLPCELTARWGLDDATFEYQFCHNHIGSRECSICLCVNRSVKACDRLPCDHTYHAKCIKTWLRRNPTCPVCRRPVGRKPQDDTGFEILPLPQPTLPDGFLRRMLSVMCFSSSELGYMLCMLGVIGVGQLLR